MNLDPTINLTFMISGPKRYLSWSIANFGELIYGNFIDTVKLEKYFKPKDMIALTNFSKSLVLVSILSTTLSLTSFGHSTFPKTSKQLRISKSLQRS